MRHPRAATSTARGQSCVWLPFASLSGRDVYDVLRLRSRVFVVEQACPYLDPDGLDPHCWHALVRDEKDALVGTARIVPPGFRYVEPSIGRVVCAPEARGRGGGRALMVSAIAKTESLFPGHAIRIGAQHYLDAFYRSLGFVPMGEPFDEDGILHVDMLRTVRGDAPLRS